MKIQLVMEVLLEWMEDKDGHIKSEITFPDPPPLECTGVQGGIYNIILVVHIKRCSSCQHNTVL